MVCNYCSFPGMFYISRKHFPATLNHRFPPYVAIYYQTCWNVTKCNSGNYGNISGNFSREVVLEHSTNSTEYYNSYMQSVCKLFPEKWVMLIMLLACTNGKQIFLNYILVYTITNIYQIQEFLHIPMYTFPTLSQSRTLNARDVII